MSSVSEDPAPFLKKLSGAVLSGGDLESLIRPLLELLEGVTGMESTYFTTVDTHKKVQSILYAYNTKVLAIPEGLAVPWDDTLCRRALAEGVGYCDDVASRWGDCTAASQLGITTYLSEPIRVGSGELYGTLCAASAQKVQVTPQTRQLLAMFAHLIARQVEREWLLVRLRRENVDYSKYALTDPLTGIANRRALEQSLTRALANAERAESSVHVAFLDLDGFKLINDQYGHDIGDRLLIKIANSLAAGMREGDLVARYGGDEFVVVGFASGQDAEAGRAAMRQRLERLTAGHIQIDTLAVEYAGASIGIVTSDPSERDAEQLLARADAAMYEIKRLRRLGLR